MGAIVPGKFFGGEIGVRNLLEPVPKAVRMLNFVVNFLEMPLTAGLKDERLFQTWSLDIFPRHLIPYADVRIKD
jgi:hypothetical protein